MRMLEAVLQGIMLFTVFATITWFLAWLLKTLIEYRRWAQVSKVQTDAHSKLLDRFTSHEDLLAYIQTPAGRRFLESAPVLEAGPRTMNAPIGRVLWSAQAGMVLAFAGLGLSFGDGAAYLGGDLLVEVGGVGLAYLDIQHGDSNTSAIMMERRRS